MRLLYGAALTAAFLLVAAASPAQSLGDAAAKEKARRKTVAKPTKVITDDDLRSGGGVSSPGTESTGTTPGASTEGGAAATPGKKEKSEEELRAEAQAEWRKKLDAANQEVGQRQSLVNDLQIALNDTSGGVYTPRRAGLQSQLEEAQKLLAESQQKLATLTEEGRRNSWR